MVDGLKVVATIQCFPNWIKTNRRLLTDLREIKERENEARLRVKLDLVRRGLGAVGIGAVVVTSVARTKFRFEGAVLFFATAVVPGYVAECVLAAKKRRERG
jgi:hypothetical protein